MTDFKCSSHARMGNSAPEWFPFAWCKASAWNAQDSLGFGIELQQYHSPLPLLSSEHLQLAFAAIEEDDSDGGRDRGWHGLPQRQQICSQRLGSKELHGGRGFCCQNWWYVLEWGKYVFAFLDLCFTCEMF